MHPPISFDTLSVLTHTVHRRPSGYCAEFHCSDGVHHFLAVFIQRAGSPGSRTSFQLFWMVPTPDVHSPTGWTYTKSEPSFLEASRALDTCPETKPQAMLVVQSLLCGCFGKEALTRSQLTVKLARLMLQSIDLKLGPTDTVSWKTIPMTIQIGIHHWDYRSDFPENRAAHLPPMQQPNFYTFLEGSGWGGSSRILPLPILDDSAHVLLTLRQHVLAGFAARGVSIASLLP